MQIFYFAFFPIYMKFLLALFAWVASLPSSLGQSFQRYSVVIHEILPDPSPPVGLPSYEYVELRNRSSTIINLKQWKLSDGSSTAVIPSDIFLGPDSMIILCSNSALPQLTLLGRAIGMTNFPSLNNEGDQLILMGPDNKVIHAIQYDLQWYDNIIKSQGGWALEMIDPSNPCLERENWKASTDPKGGTPGKENTVHGKSTDLLAPVPLRSFSIDNHSVVIQFSEPPANPALLPNIHFATTPNLPITSIEAEPPFFRNARITFLSELQPDSVYSLSVRGIKDCIENEMTSPVVVPFGLPSPPFKGDIIFNELLFNPRPGKYDFVEFYNRSNRIIDMREIYMGGLTTSGSMINPVQVSGSPFYLFPNEYLVITPDVGELMKEYPEADQKQVMENRELPSMPDEKGAIALSTRTNLITDAIIYDESWHFPLLNKKEGVSLERIDPYGKTNDPSNWTSAASLADFATPTKKNSQYQSYRQKEAMVTIDPSSFTPDNDGYNDLLGIHYKVNQPGYVMQVRVYDTEGRLVANPIPQATLASNGSVWWNGMDSNRKLLSAGNYIVWVELVHINGKVTHHRFTVTLLRRM